MHDYWENPGWPRSAAPNYRSSQIGSRGRADDFRFRAPLSAVANDLDMRTMRFGCVSGLIVRLGRHRRSGWRAVSANAVSEQSADDYKNLFQKMAVQPVPMVQDLSDKAGHELGAGTRADELVKTPILLGP